MATQITSGSMRAAVFEKTGSMSIQRIPIPEIQPGEILVKLAGASLCGSDLVPYLGYLGPNTEGLAAGHEGVGIVVKAGSMVEAFKVGDRVGFLNVLRNCQNCKPCKASEGQYCESGKLNQGFDTHGFLAEYAVVSPQFAVAIPEGLPLKRMSPLFCAGITAFRAVKLLDLPGRGVIGIFGLGGVGRLVLQFAQAVGFRTVGFDVSATAREEALQSGAEAVANSADEDEMAAVVERVSKGQQLDGAIVASGAPPAYQAAVNYTGFGGTVVTVGVPRESVALPIIDFVKKRLRLQGTQTGNPKDLEEMMALVCKNKIIPDVELQPLDDVPGLMEALSKGQLAKKVGTSF